MPEPLFGSDRLLHKDDWFREPCLTTDAKAEFDRRLSRSRAQRPEYLRIQAYALRQAGAYEDALVMLARVTSDYPDHLSAWIHESMAHCFEATGQVDAAMRSYEMSIQRMRQHPGIRANAHTAYAALIVRQKRENLFEDALAYLNEFWDPNPIFPAYEIEQFGWAAIISDKLGDRPNGVAFAERALAAAVKRRSGAANHEELGLAAERHAELLEQLDRIPHRAS